MRSEDGSETDPGEPDDDGPGASQVGALRAIGELLAAVLTVVAILGVLLVGAVVVQWLFH